MERRGESREGEMYECQLQRVNDVFCPGVSSLFSEAEILTLTFHRLWNSSSGKYLFQVEVVLILLRFPFFMHVLPVLSECLFPLVVAFLVFLPHETPALRLSVFL